LSRTLIKSALELSSLSSLKVLNICCIKFVNTEQSGLFFQELMQLDQLEILIIDFETFQKIKPLNNPSYELNKVLLKVPNDHDTGFIRSSKIIEIFNVAVKIKDPVFKNDFKKIKNILDQYFN
jgi:hypothetical protein